MQQTFEIGQSEVTLLQGGRGVALAGLVIFTGMSWLFLTGESVTITTLLRALPFFLPAILFLWVIFSYTKKIKKLSDFAVNCDNTGIWYKHLKKPNGLVSWSKITQTKDKPYSRCTELLDSNNQVQLVLKYSLQNTTQLRDMVAEKVYRHHLPPRCPLRKNPKYLLRTFAPIILLSYIALIGNWATTLAMLVIIGILIFEYATTVTQVSFTDKSFVLGFPFRKKIIPFSQVTDIKTTTKRPQENRFFPAGIFVKDRQKPYYLTQLGIDDMQLLMILRQAVKSRGE